MHNPLNIYFGYQLRDRVIMTTRDQFELAVNMPYLSVNFNVFAGGFEGVTSDYLSRNALTLFGTQLEALYKTLRGEAFLETLEGNFNVELRGDGQGHVTVQFDVMDNTARLKFGAHIDQTFLPELINQVRKVLTAFPYES